MRIVRIDIWESAPAFRGGPYVMSHVVQEAAYGRILRICSDDGFRGLGEIVYAPILNADERTQRREAESELFRALIGGTVEAAAGLVETIAARGRSWRGIAFGLDTAIFDLRARREGLRVADLLGGAIAVSVPDYFSISERTASQLRERVALAGQDRSVIQLKIGIGGLEEDIAGVRTLLSATHADQVILADFNGGRSVQEALGVIASFDEDRIFWEEPCKSYRDNVAVAVDCGRPVMFDQCAADPELAMRASDDPAVHSLCVKPAFLGGLTVAKTVRDRCAATGRRMRIDGPWCGDIANAAILSLAVGAPADLVIAGCDLREPLILEPDLGGVVHLAADRIAPPAGSGLGIDPSLDALGPPEISYE